MAEASRMNVKISMPGDKQQPMTSHRKRPPTMHEVVNWIRNQNYTPELTEALIKKVKKYPLSAMWRFREKIHQHIADIQRKKTKKNETTKNEEE